MFDLHNTSKYTTDGGFKFRFFTAVERILSVTLPDAGLKAEPHIKSRIKILKQNFAIVHDMLCGPNTSRFGYDNTRKCVVAERAVWDAYLQVNKCFCMVDVLPVEYFVWLTFTIDIFFLHSEPQEGEYV